MCLPHSTLIPWKPVDLADLAGKQFAIGALNMNFQFVAIIRDSHRPAFAGPYEASNQGSTPSGKTLPYRMAQ
jgi:hypothetical protein